MTATPKIAAGLLSANFAHLGREVTSAVRAGADWIHVDVMDQHYVPTLSVGPMVCEAIRPLTGAPLDVHLMVKPVDALVPAFAKAGADVVTFHPEATGDVRRTAALVKEHGCRVGLALGPTTPLEVLDGLLDELDVVVIMAVTPVLGAQCFIPSSLARIREVRARIAATGRAIAVEVVGDVKPESAGELVRAGADVLVAGAALFGTGDYAAAVAALKGRPVPFPRRVAVEGVA